MKNYLFYILIVTIFSGCKYGQYTAIHSDKRIKGYAAYVTYEPYSIHKIVCTGYIYKPKQMYNIEIVGYLQYQNGKDFEIMLNNKVVSENDSLMLFMRNDDIGRIIHTKISLKNDYEVSPLIVIMQPSCTSQFDNTGVKLDKYSEIPVHIPHTGEIIYPYTRYRYKCIVDQQGTCHNFEDVVEDVKKAIEEVEKKQKK